MSREKLQYVDLTNWLGLATKGVPELVKPEHLSVAINTDLYEDFGGIAKPAGTRRVLNDILLNEGTPANISWVGLYKSANLNGQILRHVLIAGGAHVYKVSAKENATLEQLTGGTNPMPARTDNLVHVADSAQDFLLIQNQDVDLIGRGDDPIKYDGKDIQRWGILAPGSTETTVETFAAPGAFTTANCTATLETTTTRDGAATSVTTDALQVNGDLTRTDLSSSPDILIVDRQSVYLYIPRGEIENFSTDENVPAVQIFVGNDLTTDYYQFDYQIGALGEGWNLLPLNYANRLNNTTEVTEDDPVVSITGTPAVPFTQFRWRLNSKDAGTVITGCVWDHHVTFDKGTCTATEDAADSVNSIFCNAGEYKYRITFMSKYGHESNAGPESVAMITTAARDIIDLTDIPVSDDPQVIARRIWRTVAGGENNLYVDTINNNTQTTYEDVTSDLANTVNGRGLGQTTPPFAGDVSDDNSPPPKAGIIKHWKQTVFLAGFPDRPEVVVYSEAGEPESFPLLNEAQLDAKITGITETYSGLIIETETGKWFCQGDNPDFTFDKSLNHVGNVGRRAQGEGRVYNWATDRDGIRLYDGNFPLKISEVIRDKFDDDFNKEQLELAQSAHSKRRNSILLLAADEDAGTGDTIWKDDSYVYQYPEDKMEQGRWWKLELPTSINPLDFEEIEDEDGTQRLYFGGDDGMLYEVFAPGEKNWTLADGTTEAIETEFKSKYMRVGEGQQGQQSEDYSGRALPRLFELRYDGDTPCSWHVRIETANGASQPNATDTTEFYIHFAENEALLRYPIKMTQPGEYVRYRLRNTDEDVAGTVTGMRIYYRTFPGQFPLETTQMNPDVSEDLP